MKKTLFSTLAIAAMAAGVVAARPATDDVPGPVMESMKALHGMTSGNLVATAKMLSDEMYGYQPTEEVRTAGQILAHVANAQFMFCSAAAGEQSPNSENFEQTRTTKDQIVAALEAGFGYCSDVYTKTSDERAAEMVSFFGQDMAVTAVLAFNTAHNYEHYGNLVTYMRINGIVPPSSGGM